MGEESGAKLNVFPRAVLQMMMASSRTRRSARVRVLRPPRPTTVDRPRSMHAGRDAGSPVTRHAAFPTSQTAPGSRKIANLPALVSILPPPSSSAIVESRCLAIGRRRLARSALPAVGTKEPSRGGRRRHGARPSARCLRAQPARARVHSRRVEGRRARAPRRACGTHARRS